MTGKYLYPVFRIIY